MVTLRCNRPDFVTTPRALAVATVLLVCGLAPAVLQAQLDPLLFLKRTAPNVIVAVDVANRMLQDADEAYYDPYTYTRTGASWEATLGVSADTALQRYRRRYVALQHLDVGGDDRFRAASIETVGDRDTLYPSFYAKTRLSVGLTAVSLALSRNTGVARFGLVKMRQVNPRLTGEKNEGPVWTSDDDQEWPTESGVTARWKITRPEVDASNASVGAAAAALVRADVATANADVITALGTSASVASGARLLPAGRDSRLAVDAPLANLLTDTRAEASRLIQADTHCRNTVVILVAGGGEGGTSNGDPAAVASTFLNVSGRRVPIYVLAIAPPAAAVDSLRAVARNSGGAYVEITKAMIDAAGGTVPEAVRGATAAIQHAFAAQADVNTAPSALLPLGPLSEFQTAGPLVGTVDLENARAASGAVLPNTRITTETGTAIPQRANVLLTAGFVLPGFEGRLRAFRLYRPESDSTKPYGWAFVTDGTPLWTATLPAAGSRNIYAALPDGRLVGFTAANAGELAAYLRASDPAALIEFVRAQPLGAIVGSTPATLDPPSLDPPPDRDYPAFAARLTGRRSFVFAGANDGMLHAFDARSGLEVWAVIPFNLLPKLRALGEGQAPGAFAYFVDGSPKIADVKINDAWRSFLTVGEGPGGTFYQTFDVTLDGLPAAVPSSSDDTTALLAFFASAERIPLVWSFPDYDAFDASLAQYGDVAAHADAVAKSVGQTWSDPAVGQVESAEGGYVAIVGSGFFPYSTQNQPQRGGIVAGTSFYLLDMADGRLLDSRSVGSDGTAETVDNCLAAGDCRRMKNALQADPVATGPLDARFITRAYIGDLDGRLWRFDLGLGSNGKARFSSDARLLFDATNTHPIFSSMASVNVGGSLDYLFFGSGSDSLPAAGVSQAYKLFGVLDNAGSGSKKFEIPLEATDRAGTDEAVSAFPAVAGDIVFFTTTGTTPTAPCSLPTANLYAVTFVGGAAYDGNGDGRLTTRDTPKLRSVAGGRATAPFAADQHMVFSAGSQVQILGDPRDFNNGVGQMGVRILSWRERR